MGIDLVYFTAPDDAAALAAERRPGGPLGWPHATGHRRAGLFRRKEPVVVQLGPACDGFPVRGYDPVVVLGTLEGLLTGRDPEAVMADPRSGGSVGDGDEADEADEGHGVITVTDSLRDALATADDARLREVVGPWRETEELRQHGWDEVSQADHLEFLAALRDLAARASRSGGRLYCYYEL